MGHSGEMKTAVGGRTQDLTNSEGLQEAKARTRGSEWEPDSTDEITGLLIVLSQRKSELIQRVII